MDNAKGARAYLIVATQVVTVAVVYYGASRLGTMAASLGGMSPFWPPSGVALVALMLFGLRVTPGITLGSLALEVTLASGFAPALGNAIGDTLAPVCAYLLLQRVGFRPELDRLKDAVALVFLAGFGAMLINSAIGPPILLATGQISRNLFGATWLVFYTGDVIGILTVTPLFLALRTGWPKLRAMPWYSWIEIGSMLVAAFAVPFVSIRQLHASYLGFLIIGWAALRYQLLAVAPCAFIISYVEVDAATRGIGPFAGENVLHRLADMQMFNGSLVLGGLFLAVIIRQRDRVQTQIEHTCTRLGEVIDHLGERESLLPFANGAKDSNAAAPNQSRPATRPPALPKNHRPQPRRHDER